MISEQDFRRVCVERDQAKRESMSANLRLSEKQAELERTQSQLNEARQQLTQLVNA